MYLRAVCIFHSFVILVSLHKLHTTCRRKVGKLKILFVAYGIWMKRKRERVILRSHFKMLFVKKLLLNAYDAFLIYTLSSFLLTPFSFMYNNVWWCVWWKFYKSCHCTLYCVTIYHYYIHHTHERDFWIGYFKYQVINLCVFSLQYSALYCCDFRITQLYKQTYYWQHVTEMEAFTDEDSNLNFLTETILE